MATFGYTSIGASTDILATNNGTQFSIKQGDNYTLSTNARIAKISVALSSDAGGPRTLDVTVAIYNYDEQLPGTSGNHTLVTSVERTSLSVSTTPTFYDFDFSDYELDAGDYMLAVIGNGSQLASVGHSINVHFDAGGDTSYFTSASSASGAYDTLRTESTWSAAEEPIADATLSIYATYSIRYDPPTVTTQAVSSIDDTTATGNGNVTADGGDTITERGVCWNTTGTPTTADSRATSAGTTGAFTASMTGLSELTTYYVRAYAINSEATSYGTEVSFTTLETPRLPVLTIQSVQDVAGTSATLYGNITETNNTATQRGFVISTSSQLDPGNTAPGSSGYSTTIDESGSFSTGSYSLPASSLSIDTTYYVRAFAQNSVGYAYSSETTFTTNGLPSISGITVSNRESESATLISEITGDGRDTVTSRGFVWSTSSQVAPGNNAPASSGYESTQGESGSFTLGTFSIDVTTFSPNSTYYVRAYAENNQGFVYTDEVNFKTRTFPGTTPVFGLPTTSTNLSNVQTGVLTVHANSTTPTTITNKQTAGSAIINNNTTGVTVTNL